MESPVGDSMPPPERGKTSDPMSPVSAPESPTGDSMPPIRGHGSPPDSCITNKESLTKAPREAGAPRGAALVSGREGSGHNLAARKRRSRIASDWQPTGDQLAWAEAQARDQGGAGIDWPAEADQFKDHHLKVGSVMADWDAAWRTWVRNAVKWNRSRPGQARGRGNAVQDAFARMDRAVKGNSS